MHESQSLGEARNFTLQKIGRNLVNLQKLEGMLKLLLATSQLEGLASQLADRAKRRAATISKMTMGEVIQGLEMALFVTNNVSQGRLDLAPEPWMSLKMTVEGGPDAARKWKSDMSGVRAERNKLVHHMLVDFDPNSLESCQALALALDAQRARLLPVYEYVESLVLASREAQEDLMRRLRGLPDSSE